MENKTGKYLKYALGEIILVVIGILIALQINNWNTGVYLKKQEKSVLLEIKRNIETNILETNLDISKIDEQVGSIEIITSHLRGDLPFHDSISGHYNRIYRGRFFNGVTSGYEILKSQPQISLNNELRFALTTYFEEHLDDVEYLMEALHEFDDKYMSDYKLIYGKKDKVTRELSETMAKDGMFMATLDLLKDNRANCIRNLETFRNQSEEILRTLQSYLENEFAIH